MAYRNDAGEIVLEPADLPAVMDLYLAGSESKGRQLPDEGLTAGGASVQTVAYDRRPSMRVARRSEATRV